MKKLSKIIFDNLSSKNKKIINSDDFIFYSTLECKSEQSFYNALNDYKTILKNLFCYKLDTLKENIKKFFIK